MKAKYCSDQCNPDVPCYRPGCPWYDNVEFEEMVLEEELKHDPTVTQDVIDGLNEMFRINSAKVYGDEVMHEQTGKYFICGKEIPEAVHREFENAKKFGLDYPGSPWREVKLFKDG